VQSELFGLSGGEFFIVAFVTIAVVSARYWPVLGERILVRLGGAHDLPESAARRSSRASQPPRE
jgi:hypothetical protein